MAFIDIKDPIKREETVKDYIRNIKEIRERRENEKMRGISQRQDLTKLFQPVVQATEKSASKITDELKNLKEEVQPKEEDESNIALENFLNQHSKSKLDQYFGVYKENGKYMIGNKKIVVDDDYNIHLGDFSFKGTTGLWHLITFKYPDVYNAEDLENYKELLDRTNVINIPHVTSAADRPKSTAKWKFFKENGIVENDDEQEQEQKKETGTGIQFLPGNIKGLIEQLHLLLAEFRAGNKSSTRNRIVAILDQLLRRNYLNQEEYNAVCRTISC